MLVVSSPYCLRKSVGQKYKDDVACNSQIPVVYPLSVYLLAAANPPSICKHQFLFVNAWQSQSTAHKLPVWSRLLLCFSHTDRFNDVKWNLTDTTQETFKNPRKKRPICANHQPIEAFTSFPRGYILDIYQRALTFWRWMFGSKASSAYRSVDKGVTSLRRQGNNSSASNYHNWALYSGHHHNP